MNRKNRYFGIILILLTGIILSSGCISEKEFSGDELTTIALDEPGVASLINGYEYEILDYGPAQYYAPGESNKQDVYYVRISIDTKQMRPIPYSIFIDKRGIVIQISKEFPTIDPATLEPGIINKSK
ncbi:MAG: hypothetical protein PHV39_07035 [Methanomicrobium sp.]|nr:hypothetical protein [Methanomicrobium sp.]